MALSSNLVYAKKYFGVETLQTRHVDDLDFHTVNVADVRKLVVEVSSDAGTMLSDALMDHLIHTWMWKKDEGFARPQGNDDDLHSVSIFTINAFIDEVIVQGRFYTDNPNVSQPA